METWSMACKRENVMEEQEKKNYTNTFYNKVQQTAENLETKTDKLYNRKKKIVMEKRIEEESDAIGKKRQCLKNGQRNKMSSSRK